MRERFRLLPGVCWGTWNGQPCPVSAARHRRGTEDGMGLIHYADRRLTKRSVKRLLMMVAARNRRKDPEFLNDPVYDFLYPYLDSVEAQRLAQTFGSMRLPARLFDVEREVVRYRAAMRGVALGSPWIGRRWSGLDSWLRRTA